MKCPTCGTEQEAGTLFCEICGALLKTAEQPAAPVPAQPQPEPVPAQPQPEPVSEAEPGGRAIPAPAQAGPNAGRLFAKAMSAIKKPVSIGKVKLSLGAVAGAGAALVIALAVILVAVLPDDSAMGGYEDLSEPTAADYLRVNGDWYQDASLSSQNLYINQSQWWLYKDAALVTSGALYIDSYGSLIVMDEDTDLYMEIEPDGEGQLLVYEDGAYSYYCSYEEIMRMNDTDQPFPGTNSDAEYGNTGETHIIEEYGFVVWYPPDEFLLSHTDSNWARIATRGEIDAVIQVEVLGPDDVTSVGYEGEITEAYGTFTGMAIDSFLQDAWDIAERNYTVYRDMDMVLTHAEGIYECMLAGSFMIALSRVESVYLPDMQQHYFIAFSVAAPESSFNDFYSALMEVRWESLNATNGGETDANG